MYKHVVNSAFGSAAGGATASQGGGGGDPYWSSVVLLAVNDNQADTTTTFDDQSTSNKTLTANGAAQYDTAQAPTGMTSSMLLDGTLDYLSTPDSADWDFAAGDFTVECWVRYGTVAQSWLVSQATNATGAGAWGLIGQLSGALDGYYTTDGLVGTRRDVDNTAWAPGTTGWHHVALSRAGTNARMFVDGTQHGTTFNSGTDALFNGSSQLCIGADNLGDASVNGWMCSIRITKGVARYTADFTPPTLPLPTS